jgi:hypothetical protein
MSLFILEHGSEGQNAAENPRLQGISLGWKRLWPPKASSVDDA